MYRPCWHLGCTFNCNKSTSSLKKKKKKSSRFWKNSHKGYTIRPEGEQMETLLISRAATNISESRRRVGALRKPQGSRPQPKIFKKGVDSWGGMLALPVLRWYNGPEMETTHVGTCDIASQVQPHAGEPKLLLPLSWRTQQRWMSPLARRPQWWAAKWIPQGGEEELGASQEDKQRLGRHQSWRHRSVGGQDPRSGPKRSILITSHHKAVAPHVVSRHTRCPLAKVFISFSSSRQRLAPLTCLTHTRSVF